MLLREITEATLMKIQVNRIPEDGLRERVTYDPAALDMEREDVHLVQPFSVEAFATLADTELVVDVDIRCPVRLLCARCLEEFDSTVTAKSLFTYKVGANDVVDITEDVRQEIILAYPMVAVCRPECKGLCAACGQNLNAGSCSHQAQAAR